MAKLKWNVERDKDGNIVRRKADGDQFQMDHVDVVWTHPDGFPAPVERRPVSYDYEKKEHTYKEVTVGERPDKLIDMVSVAPGASDVMIERELDAKRVLIARNLGIEP